MFVLKIKPFSFTTVSLWNIKQINLAWLCHGFNIGYTSPAYFTVIFTQACMMETNLEILALITYFKPILFGFIVTNIFINADMEKKHASYTA